MRKKIIYEPTMSDTAVLILEALGKIFIQSFWPHPYYHTFCEHGQRRSFRNAVNRLEMRGLIIGERQKNGQVAFYLSPGGEKLANRITLKLKLAKNKRWDGKWRLLIFDIPEKVRGKRDFFRRELIDFGFFPLQKSVLAYPYQLPPEFFELWEDLDFRKQLVVVESAKIANDEDLRAFFGLD